MHHVADILFIIFVAAQAGAEIAQRLKLPGVAGEIAAGCTPAAQPKAATPHRRRRDHRRQRSPMR